MLQGMLDSDLRTDRRTPLARLKPGQDRSSVAGHGSRGVTVTVDIQTDRDVDIRCTATVDIHTDIDIDIRFTATVDASRGVAVGIHPDIDMDIDIDIRCAADSTTVAIWI